MKSCFLRIGGMGTVSKGLQKWMDTSVDALNAEVLKTNLPTDAHSDGAANT